MEKKRVLIVGLPLFASRLAKELNEYDADNSYLALDTYYNFFHKLLAPLQILRADVVYSINGFITKSAAINLALKLKKRVVMHWVGTDVTKAIQSFKEGNYLESYMKVDHLTDAPWLKEELKEIGLNAKVQYISAYPKEEKILEFPKEFRVLAYIPENRADYYGRETILKLAKEFEEVKFLIAGSNADGNPTLNNIEYLGWVDNMSDYINKSVVAIRYIEHDGLSQFVLETMAKGRYVFYNYNLEGVVYTPSYSALVEELKIHLNRFKDGKLFPNEKGIKVIEDQFSHRKVLQELKEYLLK